MSWSEGDEWPADPYGDGGPGDRAWDEDVPQRWPLTWRGLLPRERWLWFERLWSDVCTLRERYRLAVGRMLRFRWSLPLRFLGRGDAADPPAKGAVRVSRKPTASGAEVFCEAFGQLVEALVDRTRVPLEHASYRCQTIGLRHWCQPDDGRAVSRDNDLLTPFGPLHEPEQLGARLIHVNLGHEPRS